MTADPDVFAAYSNHKKVGQDDESLSDFTAHYAGTWDTERDFAENWIQQEAQRLAACGTPVPEPFASYFDVTGYAQEMFADIMFSITLPHGNVAVFHLH